MKIAIPTDDKKGLDGKVAEHFGRCLAYTFLDEDGNVIEIIDNTSEHMGGTGLPPEFIKKHGANVMLCGGLGFKALELCSQFEIDVYICSSETVREIFEMWKNNKIKKANISNVCDGH